MKVCLYALLLCMVSIHGYTVDCNDPRNRMDWQCQDKRAPVPGSEAKERANPVRTIKHVPGRADVVMEHHEDSAEAEAAGVATPAHSTATTTAQDAEIAQAIDRVAQAVDRQTNVILATTVLSIVISIVSMIIISN